MSSKVIVITGASAGVGAATAKLLAARGDRVVLAARRLAELKQVAEQCGAGALTVVTDVTRRADVEHLRDEALRAFGTVDVWINNAGRALTRPVLDLTDAGHRAPFQGTRGRSSHQRIFSTGSHPVRQFPLSLQRLQSGPEQPDR